MSNDMKRMAEALSRIEGSNPEYTGSIRNAARTFIRREISLTTAATHANAGNAIAANASPYQWRAPGNGRLLTAHFIPAVAATANASDYSTIACIKTQSNGVGAGTSIATQTTKPTANGGLGSLTTGGEFALTVTDSANARFTRGQKLAPLVTMTGNGVAMGAGTLELVVELEQAWDEAS